MSSDHIATEIGQFGDFLFFLMPVLGIHGFDVPYDLVFLLRLLLGLGIGIPLNDRRECDCEADFNQALNDPVPHRFPHNAFSLSQNAVTWLCNESGVFSNACFIRDRETTAISILYLLNTCLQWVAEMCIQEKEVKHPLKRSDLPRLHIGTQIFVTYFH